MKGPLYDVARDVHDCAIDHDVEGRELSTVSTKLRERSDGSFSFAVYDTNGDEYEVRVSKSK